MWKIGLLLYSFENLGKSFHFIFLIIRCLNHSYTCLPLVFWAARNHHFCTWLSSGYLDPSLATSLSWWMHIRCEVLILAWNLSYWLGNVFFFCTFNIFFGALTIIGSLASNKTQQIKILSRRPSDNFYLKECIETLLSRLIEIIKNKYWNKFLVTWYIW